MLPPRLHRITFYLAQTLMAIARHEEAYGWYERRVALGGWHVSGLQSHVCATAAVGAAMHALWTLAVTAVSSVCIHWALPWLCSDSRDACFSPTPGHLHASCWVTRTQDMRQLLSWGHADAHQPASTGPIGALRTDVVLAHCRLAGGAVRVEAEAGGVRPGAGPLAHRSAQGSHIVSHMRPPRRRHLLLQKC
jgi:hypothetical protein